ncbi:unnamed protein product [Allacma fusca]|uniref:Trans-1,2-dihydrobenzene-1,2-diol dehydrogenase n=1 Tax=Allacma fusca TaxID=39272 RepID=A0A8J2LBI2_9HEXA|nr:unnamed protein product [Allacma fusca]
MALHWGILGTGLISNDFMSGFVTLPTTEHQLVAVGARNLEAAANFATQYKIPKAYGSYEELAQDPTVDIIYIGNITSRHYPWAKICLQHGKHVLCEKPLCVNAKEAKDLVAYAKKKNLFLMEAIWSRHFPAYHKLREELERKTIGDVLQIIVPFGIPASPQGYHLKPRETGAGTMNDIGVYCVQVATLVFGKEKPKVISAGHLNDDGVDASTSSTLVYSNGRTATLVTSSFVELANEAVLIGTKGTIKIPFPFWSPNKLETPDKTYEYELPRSSLKPILLHSEGLSYQCEEARRCIRNGLIESPNLPHNESVVIAEIIEDIRKQVGVKYPADEDLDSDKVQECYGVGIPTD